MDPRFLELIDQLEPKLARLVEQPPMTEGRLRDDIPKSGVYLFSEAGQPLYVGRSNDLRGRYGRHSRPGATHRQAAFAFQLARRATGNTVAAYRRGSRSRTGLMLDQNFVAEFGRAKARIRAMEYRCVEEQDQNRQALLEIYCAVVLGTPYNDFRTY